MLLDKENQMKNKKRKQAGYSIIELLTVIFLLAGLTVFGTFMFLLCRWLYLSV